MRLTPPEQRAPAAKFPQPSASLLILGGAVAILALAVFSSAIHDDPFVDEYAYITQAYYSDLFLEGRRDDPLWLDIPALDLQPLPKYFIGPALHAVGVKTPTPAHALRWYRDAHTRYGPPKALTASRIPFIATGILGTLSLLGCGLVLGGRRVGAIAAVLLVANPLFRLHAHRAMSDVPCEAFMIASLGLALAGAVRTWSGRLGVGWALFAAAGVCSGLSIVCKLNGLLAPMTMAAWCGLGVLVPRLSGWARLGLAGGFALAIVAMAIAMIALNPVYTSHPRTRFTNADLAARAAHGPWGRFRDLVRYRIEGAAGQRQMSKFSPDVVRTPADKLAVFAVQGFGRFGPLGPSKSDSTRRYDPRQDWGLLLWWPLVLFGIVRSYRLAQAQLREGSPPTALALLIWAAVSWAVVCAYLPLAWDRYLLPIQAPDALLAAVGLSAMLGRLSAGWRPAASHGSGRGTGPPPSEGRPRSSPWRSRLRPAIFARARAALDRRGRKAVPA